MFQCLKCVVIPEESLEAVKSTFSVITSSHIYSVGKCKVQVSSSLFCVFWFKTALNLIEHFPVLDGDPYIAISSPVQRSFVLTSCLCPVSFKN